MLGRLEKLMGKSETRSMLTYKLCELDKLRVALPA